MARVKIKYKSPDRESKLKLLEILCKNQIHVTKIISTIDGFVVLTLNDDEADTIFAEKTKEELDRKGFSPMQPPELRAKKSVLIFNVDDIILDNTTEEIKDELLTSNPWITCSIENIYKFPRSPIMKVTFSQTSISSKCTESGILIFNLSIPKHDIKQETFIPILTCMKCYLMEDHITKNCTRERDYKICSECSEEGHTWRDCKSATKKCINCHGNHSTLAMKCPDRKDIIKMKRQTYTEIKPQTFAEATRNRVPIMNSPPMTNKQDVLKITTCIIHAHFRNMEKPGSYETELNKILKLNDLPEIKIPDAPDSRNFFASVNAEKDTDTRQEEEVEGSQDERSQQQTSFTVSGKDIGLQIFTSQDKGWPTGNFTVTDLMHGIENKEFKWTYGEQTISADDVLNMIKNSTVDLKGCWRVVDRGTFRKIRSGLAESRSPLEKRDLRHRKLSQ